MFRDKMAYPIYMTIGNIPKQTRRTVSCHAQILIGYIPTTKLSGISNKAARRRALANLYHACMRDVLGPITSYGETGLDLRSGDGVWRRCHPIFATFVGDYPEQVLVTCTYNGRCPKCTVPYGQLGTYEAFPPRVQSTLLDTYQLADGDVYGFHRACRDAGMKPIYHPFWETFPLMDIFYSITPDLLHQMLQGMVKHLISWVVSIFGAAAIDSRCHAMPPNHNIMLFTKGISSLSRVLGLEHKRMCSILLGLVVDLPVPGGADSTRIIRAVRALMDFLYLARYESHTSDTILELRDCLTRFHDNKSIFIDLGIRENFNFPKLHSLSHYASSIQLFGTTDNYNTEQSERLHIDFAKDAYRATNRKDEYSQMTKWLERRERIQELSTFVDQTQEHEERQLPPYQKATEPPHACNLNFKMAQYPTKKRVEFDVLARDHGAVDFQDALADFIAQINSPGVSGAALRHRAHDTHIPFSGVPVYYKIKFTKGAETKIVDAVHIRPEQIDARGRINPGRFDTVLVNSSGPNRTQGQGNKGNCFTIVLSYCID
jgi:hypothetical protein